MTQTLEQLVVELRADVGSLRTQLRVADGLVASTARSMDSRLRGVEVSFGRVGAGIKAVGIGIVGALGAAGVGSVLGTLSRLTREAIESGGNLADLSKRTGLSAERFQELRFAVSQAGGAVAAVDPALVAFGRNLSGLERGTGSLATFLKKADPEFAALLQNAESIDEALGLVADRMAALTSQEDRLALAQAALGRGGRELVNVLAEGSAGIAEYARQARDAGAVISNDAIARADELADAVGRVADVMRARFAGAVLDAKGGAAELLETLSDPEKIKAIGDLAADVGELASSLLKLAAAAGRAVEGVRDAFKARELGHAWERDFARFDATLAERAKGGPTLSADQVAGLAPVQTGTRITLGAAERKALGIKDPAPAPRFGSTLGNFDPDAGKDAAKSEGRDPLATAVGTIREELATLEKLAEERKRFEDEVTRDLEAATLSRVELIERETSRRLAELERLGFAEEEAAELRAKIQEESAARIAEANEASLEGLIRIAEVGVETIGDFLAGALLEQTEAGFDELLASFAKTLLRMEITAAATSIGEILKGKLSAGAGGGSSSAKGAAANAGGSVLLALAGKAFGFAEGGVVMGGPVVGVIGEDPATRPEIVMPLDRFEKMQGGGASIEVVNAVPGVRAKARRVRQNGRERTLIELEAAFGSLLSRGAFRDQLGGRHAPGMR
ncbi:MAG: hypothetical protein DCC71_02925 [Proteobacteria bacterium]|nr:MAG: hypothetical protein DCC71_02925 [Pseudomonadota bacterium]